MDKNTSPETATRTDAKEGQWVHLPPIAKNETLTVTFFDDYSYCPGWTPAT